MAGAKRSTPRMAQERELAHLRVPPHSIEAEQAVLGALVLVPESYDQVADILTEQDFYRRDHQIIYRSIRGLAEKNQPFDAVTLSDWCVSNGLEGETGGLSYFVDLAAGTPSAANIGAYANVVRERSLLRQLIDVSTSSANEAFQPAGRSAREILDAAEASVLAIAESGAKGLREYQTLREALIEAFDAIQQRHEAGGQVTGLSTGYAEFDRYTAGLQPTDLIVLAGRPSMGKTALSLNIAEHVAVNVKQTVAVFSMEMAAGQLAMRLISSNGRVHAERLRTGQLEDEDWPRVNAACQTLRNAKVIIDAEPALSPERLRAKARRIKREHGLGLIVIDYLQLMEVPGSGENRATEISAISRSLKGLAKELNVPVIALSQLNRSLESRTDKRPVMADLRESGAIEQDADMIVFLYRDEYYNRENSPDKGLAEVIIGKQRNGPTGSFKLKFFGEYTRFDNLGHDGRGTFE